MSILDQFAKGWQMGGEMAAQKKKTTLAGLLQQAHGATGDARKGFIGQAIGIDPDAGMAMQSQFDVQDKRSLEEVVASARLLVKAPEPMRAQLYASQILPKLKSLGYPAPDQYGPEVDQYAQQIASAWGPAEEEPAGVREFNALTANLPESDRDRALRVHLGLEARAAQPGQPNIIKSDDGRLFAVTPEGYREVGPAGQMAGPSGGASQVLESSLQDVIGPAIAPLGGRITSTTGGQHNPGSAHYSGNAIDVGMARETPEQQAQILAALSAIPGVQVRDERARPPGQQVWSGPHLHVERARSGGQAQPTFGKKQPAGPKVPSGYRLGADGQSLEPIPGGPAQVAIDARNDAAAARKAAEDLKAAQKQRETDARTRESVSAATQLISAIDELTKSSGFGDLGTTWGDVQIGTPLVRNDAKDANAQLKNVAGQVALATMSRLKALSAQGATGFGALSAPELKLLENSIATLQAEDVSNAQLRKSLKTIRDTMNKVAGWNPQQASGGSDIDALLEKYK